MHVVINIMIGLPIVVKVRESRGLSPLLRYEPPLIESIVLFSAQITPN